MDLENGYLMPDNHSKKVGGKCNCRETGSEGLPRSPDPPQPPNSTILRNHRRTKMPQPSIMDCRSIIPALGADQSDLREYALIVLRMGETRQKSDGIRYCAWICLNPRKACMMPHTHSSCPVIYPHAPGPPPLLPFTLVRQVDGALVKSQATMRTI